MAHLFFVLTMIASNVVVITTITTAPQSKASRGEIVISADASPIGIDDQRSGESGRPLPTSPLDLTDEDIPHCSGETLRPSATLAFRPFFRTSLRSAFDTHFLESIPRRGADRPPDSLLS